MSDIKTDEEYLNEFLFIVWFPNPLKDIVRIILDDGSIKMTMKRDKFLKIMSDILNNTFLKECQYTLFRIKESLNNYGGIYFYDRRENSFIEVKEKLDFNNINPQQIIIETRKNIALEKIKSNFVPEQVVNKDYDTLIKSVINPKINKKRNLFSFFRDFSK